MKKSKIFLVISFIFLIGNLIWLLFFDIYNPNPKFEYNEFYTFKTRIKSLDKKLDGWNAVLGSDNLSNFDGEIIAYLSLYPEYEVGDIIEISCKITKPEPIQDDEGSFFAYEKFLAKENIFGICFRARITIIESQKNFVNKSKDYMWKNLNNNLTEPVSALSKAITLGTKREIPDSVRDIFAKTGLSHIIAISGLHIAMIILILQRLFILSGLSRKQSIIFLFLAIIFYLYILDFPSSAIRASAMTFILLIGPLIGRQTTSIFSLVFLADIFLLFNKHLLLHDIGFQLSFLAVLGILLYSNYFIHTLFFLPRFLKLREIFSVTLAAQVFTWPIVIYNFKIMSIISPIANFIILPILPIVLVLNFLLTFFGNIYYLAIFFSSIIQGLFKILLDITKLMSNIPYAYVEINDFSAEYLIISFVFIIIITLILKPYNYEKV